MRKAHATYLLRLAVTETSQTMPADVNADQNSSVETIIIISNAGPSADDTEQWGLLHIWTEQSADDPEQ